jgi:NAD(P)-dependent dehydrogenase (short-subunit alcohol dehydrogenase family)
MNKISQFILFTILLLFTIRIFIDPETPLHGTWTQFDAKQVVDKYTNKNALTKQQVLVITGGATGLGFDIVRALSPIFKTIYIASKNDRLGLISQLNTTSQNIYLIPCDLSSLSQIKHFAQEVLSRESKIDLLILNAGLMIQRLTFTEENNNNNNRMETTWAVNHVANQALFIHVLPALLSKTSQQQQQQRKSRVIVVSSSGHRLFLSPPWSLIGGTHVVDDFPYDGSKHYFYNFLVTYGASKAANILFAYEIAKRYGNDILVYSVHPGFVRSGFMQPRPPPPTCKIWTFWDYFDIYIVAPCTKIFFTILPLTLSSSQGAGVVLYPALLSEKYIEENKIPNGSYFMPGEEIGNATVDFGESEALWQKTMTFINPS